MNSNESVQLIFIIFQIVWYNIIGLFSLYKGSLSINNSVYQSAAIHGIVCFINAFCRILEFISFDRLYIGNRSVNYLRYIEWLSCTPLMILEITLASHFSAAQTIPVIVLTVAFCISGIIAAMSNIMWIKLILGIKGSLYYFIVIFQLWKITLKKRDFYTFNKELQVAFANLIFASLLWPLFIITWGLGPDIYHIINIKQEFIAECITSLVIKTFALSFALISTSQRTEKFIELITGFLKKN